MAESGTTVSLSQTCLCSQSRVGWRSPVATADGVNMILDTLAEAFQGEHDASGSHTVYVSQSKEALVKSEEQEGDTDVETALTALAQECDTDLEETHVQEILLAGLQRTTTVTGRVTGELWLQVRDRAHQWRETLSSWGRGSISESCPDVHVAASVVRRDTGQVHARTEENKCPEMAKRRRHHSLSTSEETTARQVTLARE